MTILDRLLHELRSAKGPISNADLARRLDVAPSALDMMISVLASKGKLVGDTDSAAGEAMACSGVACGTTCVGIDNCAFVVSVPQTHRLVISSPTR